MTIAIPLVGWLLVAGAIAAIRIDHIRRHPEDAPGGGIPAIVVVALLWPLVLPVAIVALGIAAVRGDL